jgi:hypothetical protein
MFGCLKFLFQVTPISQGSTEKTEPEKPVVKKQKRGGELSCEFKAFKVKVSYPLLFVL